MREKLFRVIELAEDDSKLSRAYDIMMMVFIVLSIVPLAFKQEFKWAVYTDYVTAGVFILDYLLRWITADLKLRRGGWSFAIYPFTPMAIVDLISILPTFFAINSAFKVLRIARLLRAFRVFRVFKVIRYSKSISIIVSVLKKQSRSLATVAMFAMGYILIAALVVFNVEPSSFDNFFSAIYWATVSLTTVGYGDIYPVSTMGRIVTMVSSILGIAIIALPSGIITAGFMSELSERNEHQEEERQKLAAEDDTQTEDAAPHAMADHADGYDAEANKAASAAEPPREQPLDGVADS